MKTDLDFTDQALQCLPPVPIEPQLLSKPFTYGSNLLQAVFNTSSLQSLVLKNCGLNEIVSRSRLFLDPPLTEPLLSSQPETIGSLALLVKLDISDNKIKVLPQAMEGCANLEVYRHASHLTFRLPRRSHRKAEQCTGDRLQR